MGWRALSCRFVASTKGSITAWVRSLKGNGSGEKTGEKQRRRSQVLQRVPVADELVDAVVIDSDEALSELPDHPLQTGIRRRVNSADGPVQLALRMWEAELNGDGLQGVVILEEEESSGGIGLVRGGVYSFQIWHDNIMVA
ncbi:hypothetical protein AXF42_Ash014293 [Apostasia shenzhenica]|uniref:Uncharacterized protein n=1 Tax=Apostasia shenzhenica TaxID=1088818 RepID=A0A2I0B0Q3_9ASPA|nr:hypothetical protein AXF42_Ash014293 [Apostasia shenzhenica]